MSIVCHPTHGAEFSLFLTLTALWVACFQRTDYDKGRGYVTLQWRSLADTTSSAKWPRSKSTVKVMWIVCALDMMMRRAIYLCVHPPQNTYPSVKHQANSNWVTFYIIPLKHWSQEKQSHETHRLKETKKTWELHAVWYPGWDPGTERGKSG